MGLDEVCFGVAGVLGCCVKNFMDVLLLFNGFSCCGDPETVPCAKFGRVHFVIQRNVSFWEVLPKVDYEEFWEEHTYSAI